MTTSTDQQQVHLSIIDKLVEQVEVATISITREVPNMDDVMAASEQEIDQHLAEAMALEEKERGEKEKSVTTEVASNNAGAEGSTPSLQSDHDSQSADAADAALDCYEALTNDLEMNDTRVAVIGNVDSGKSTIIGVLTSGSLDNGRGQARSYVMKHRHELDNGRTSAVTVEIMGFKNTSTEAQQVIPTARHHDQRWHEVMEKSDHTISLIDLCGHEKYLKTTLFGLTGLMPDYAMLIVGK